MSPHDRPGRMNVAPRSDALPDIEIRSREGEDSRNSEDLHSAPFLIEAELRPTASGRPRTVAPLPGLEVASAQALALPTLEQEISMNFRQAHRKSEVKLDGSPRSSRTSECRVDRKIGVDTPSLEAISSRTDQNARSRRMLVL